VNKVSFATRGLKGLAAVVSGLSLVGLSLSGAVLAQSFPARPIVLVVPFAAGGPTDILARTLAQAMTKNLGQSVVVENTAGAGGTIAASRVARAASDGHTLLIHHNGMASSVGLYRKLPFNPLTDFEYISQVADVPMTLLAKKGFPPNTLQELIPYLRENKEKVNLAHAGLGAVSQLCGMLFQKAIGVDLTTVPYKGTAPAMADLLGGQVEVLCDQTTQTIPQINAGTVKFYGVTTDKRIAALPNAPTLQEGGLKGFQMVVWHGVYAPKGTPKAIQERLTLAVQESLKQPEVIKKIAELGAEIVPKEKQTSDGLRIWLKSEIDKWVPIIKASGQYAD
jgi:tripartite-type tricarboxylate transporter receptor subunit TctC